MNTPPVKWTLTAEDQLADIWLHAADPAAVTRTGAAIDRLLARDPWVTGSKSGKG